jgi:glucoamylase
LTTLAVSEQLYDALTVWDSQGEIEVTETSVGFFQLFLSSAEEGTYASDSDEYATIVAGVKEYADGFVEVVAQYTPDDGALSEQYDKSTGAQTSAVDLTWSYASAITAFRARDGWTPEPWGAAGLEAPSECTANPGSPGGGATVAVSFNVNAETVLGGRHIFTSFYYVFDRVYRILESIFVTGSVDALANWSPDNAIALSADDYPVWKGKSFEKLFSSVYIHNG